MSITLKNNECKYWEQELSQKLNRPIEDIALYLNEDSYYSDGKIWEGGSCSHSNGNFFWNDKEVIFSKREDGLLEATKIA